MTAVGFVMVLAGFAVHQAADTLDEEKAGGFVTKLSWLLLMAGVFIKIWEVMP